MLSQKNSNLAKPINHNYCWLWSLQWCKKIATNSCFIVKLLRFYDKMILKYFCCIDFTLIWTRLREDFCTMHHDIRCNSHRVYLEMGEKFHLPSARNFGRIKYKYDYLSYGSKQTLTWIWTLHWVFKCTMRHFLWQMCMYSYSIKKYTNNLWNR